MPHEFLVIDILVSFIFLSFSVFFFWLVIVPYCYFLIFKIIAVLLNLYFWSSSNKIMVSSSQEWDIDLQTNKGNKIFSCHPQEIHIFGYPKKVVFKRMKSITPPLFLFSYFFKLLQSLYPAFPLFLFFSIEFREKKHPEGKKPSPLPCIFPGKTLPM